MSSNSQIDDNKKIEVLQELTADVIDILIEREAFFKKLWLVWLSFIHGCSIRDIFIKDYIKNMRHKLESGSDAWLVKNNPSDIVTTKLPNLVSKFYQRLLVLYSFLNNFHQDKAVLSGFYSDLLSENSSEELLPIKKSITDFCSIEDIFNILENQRDIKSFRTDVENKITDYIEHIPNSVILYIASLLKPLYLLEHISHHDFKDFFAGFGGFVKLGNYNRFNDTIGQVVRNPIRKFYHLITVIGHISDNLIPLNALLEGYIGGRSAIQDLSKALSQTIDLWNKMANNNNISLLVRYLYKEELFIEKKKLRKNDIMIQEYINHSIEQDVKDNLSIFFSLNLKEQLIIEIDNAIDQYIQAGLSKYHTENYLIGDLLGYHNGKDHWIHLALRKLRMPRYHFKYTSELNIINKFVYRDGFFDSQVRDSLDVLLEAMNQLDFIDDMKELKKNISSILGFSDEIWIFDRDLQTNGSPLSRSIEDSIYSLNQHQQTAYDDLYKKLERVDDEAYSIISKFLDQIKSLERWINLWLGKITEEEMDKFFGLAKQRFLKTYQNYNELFFDWLKELDYFSYLLRFSLDIKGNNDNNDNLVSDNS